MLDMFFAASAHAQEAAAPAQEGGLNSFLGGPGLMLLAMFAIFYFLLIRPQQKKAKAARQMLDSLRKGDDVLTNGGIFGRVTGISGEQLVLEIAPQVRIKITRSSITQILSGLSQNQPAEEKKKS
ncbi:MAG: preprotein translocase subunit YajC [Desulfarculales bacterium]|jgi:preprotein translocase subunit YajC|nr:preprotein translocase subunit YajC [Desulfarculales bacterium]